MGTYYTLYAEAKIRDKWFNFNPFIRNVKGELTIAPIYGWEQSYFREAYDELTDLFSGRGYPEDMCEELKQHFRVDEVIKDIFGKEVTRQQDSLNHVSYVNNGKNIASRIVPGMYSRFQGYVKKRMISAFQLGEAEDISEWLDKAQYNELSEKEKRQWSYFEWDYDDSWYEQFRNIQKQVEAMRYWFGKNAGCYGTDYDYDDMWISQDNIRIILIRS